jgi:hypothetical protein
MEVQMGRTVFITVGISIVTSCEKERYRSRGMQNQGKLARSKIITSRLSLSGKVREQFYDNIPGLNYRTLWYIMLLEFVFIIS